MNRLSLVLGAVAFIALGSTATYVLMRREAVFAPVAPESRAEPAVQASPTPAAAVPEVSVTLSKEAVARAGIVIGKASAPSGATQLRIPAVVEPNAYRSVVVTPIVAGRVTSVAAELGQAVRRGQTLAQLYSPELAEAQSRYLAARAELDAHERELRRTERLAEIGSASGGELERVHAEHTAATAMVQSLRSRLTLLGMTGGQIDELSAALSVTAITGIPAPIDGVITARTANIGLNVDPATQLFTVVDLSTVWLVGDVYERDLARVRIGTPVLVTSAAYPELTLEGRVSYIDPAINPQTRTARVRVEVPNPGRQLRLGMYVEMKVVQSPESKAQSLESKVVVVPREAVQIVGNRSVVYVADGTQAGRFIEREVEVGGTTGDTVEVTRGLQAGDPVVIGGSFSLRAERERLGLHSASSAAPTQPVSADRARILVSGKGFEPPRVSGRIGIPLVLTFVRTADATCATEVVIPSQQITRTLPLNQPVEIRLTPQKTGDIAFACGMDMLQGAIAVQ